MNHFLRTMPPYLVQLLARDHDQAIMRCFSELFGIADAGQLDHELHGVTLDMVTPQASPHAHAYPAYFVLVYLTFASLGGNEIKENGSQTSTSAFRMVQAADRLGERFWHSESAIRLLFFVHCFVTLDFQGAQMHNKMTY